MNDYTKDTKVLVTSIGSHDRPYVDIVSRVSADNVWLAGTTLNAFHAGSGLERRKGRASYQIRPATPTEVEEYRLRCETDRLVRIVERYLWDARAQGQPTPALQELASIVEKIPLKDG